MSLDAAETLVTAAAAQRSGWPNGRFWPLRRPSLALAALFVVLLLVASLAPHWLTGADPLAASARQAFQPPSAAHWLGTDENGRDLYARLVHGARGSLLIGLSATLLAVFGGVFLGLAAGLGHRWLDAAIMRLLDALLAFPDVLLALLVITFWGGGLLNLVIAIGVAGIPRYARLVRAQTQRVRGAPYVEAAITLGLARPLVVLKHVLPNAIKPVLVLATLGVGVNIVLGAGLSFLGFGAPPPAPEWGGMLSTARNFLANAWWLVAFPSIALTFTVVAVTTLGRALARHLEGRAP